MHELSIAHSLIESAEEAAREAGAERVTRVQLRLGELAGVVKESLLFSFDVATKGTLLEGAVLEIEELPLVVYCPHCAADFSRSDGLWFRCPGCDVPSNMILQGRELELASIEVSGSTMEAGKDTELASHY